MIADARELAAAAGRFAARPVQHAPAPPPAGYRATRSGLLAPDSAFGASASFSPLPFDLPDVGGGRHYRQLRRDPARRTHVRDRLSSADAIGQLSNAELRSISRDLARNEPVYAGAIDNFVTTALGGPFGPVPAPMRKMIEAASREEIDAFVRAAKKEWRRWSRRPFVGMNLNWARGVQLVLRCVLEGFDCFAVRQRRTDREIGRLRGPSLSLAWQLLDAEQIADGAPGLDVAQGNTVAGGVEKDPSGECVALHVYERHPGDLTPIGGGSRASLYRTRRIPWRDAQGRENVVAIFRPTRVGQSRGVSPLVSGMQLASDMGELRDSALVALKVSTMLSTFRVYNRDNPAAPGRSGVVGAQGEDFERSDRATFATEYLQPGMIGHLEEGEDIRTVNPPQVSPVLREISETMLVQLGSLIGTSYEVITRDFRQTNYSSARAAFALTWRAYQAVYEMLSDTIVRASYEGVIEEGVARGRIPLPGYDPRRHRPGDDPFDGAFEEWAHYDLITPGVPHIDKLKELQGDEKAIEIGVATRAEIAAGKGADYEDLPERRADEERELDELGLPSRLRRGPGRSDPRPHEEALA